MNNLFAYLVELNISLMILFVAYKLFFEKDKNFTVRRIYLLGVLTLPVILPFIPDSIRMPVARMAPISISLEEVTVLGSASATGGDSSISFTGLFLLIYLFILALGILKVFIQLTRIGHIILRAKRFTLNGTPLLASKALHASSFFGYIFIDPACASEHSISHILEHENIHKREWHSVDRILLEIFVIVNWFNPVAWMFRRSVIENLEYLADSAVLRKGTDPTKYQLSILNQYIGSASISNQFSSQIKNRINMLNKNYKLGSRWKLVLLLPLTVIAFLVVSCTDKDAPIQAIEPAEEISADMPEEEVFYVVEEMPTFNGEEAIEFRRYIAQNLIYPPEAAEQGATGKILINFIVTKEGKVEVPDQETMAKIEGKELGEVVVTAYSSYEGQDEPEEQYIQMLKDEVKRVVLSSPDWVPGKQRGKAVDVLFTFPVNFVLQ
ncbi:MAG: M56 family metallopeptidase [Bacteroidales bacterium]|nr:M56 family metallopeptidase [Bacteroidales bacterium]